MGSLFLSFVVLIVIGAFIGGMTNSVAIKMLFRPYKAIYIGKFRVPFTPGVIPKRQEEIADSLGDLVMKHLITADSIEKKLKEDRFSKVIIERVKHEVTRRFDSEKSLGKWLDQLTDSGKLVSQLEGKTTTWLTDEIKTFIDHYKDLPLNDVIPEGVQEKIENRLPYAAEFLADRVVDYFESEEGRLKVKEQLDSYFDGKGRLGNMIGMFLGNQSIVDRVYPELIKFLKQAAFRNMLLRLIEKEWLKFQTKPASELAKYIGVEEEVLYENVSKQIHGHLPYHKWLNASLGELAGEWKQSIVDDVVPRLVNSGLSVAAKKASELLKSLEIEGMVTDQVRAFSVHELEQVILIISKREFKMITYLGAVLGGLIGLFQGIFLAVIG